MRVELSPVTRIEGHLSVHTECEPATDAEGRQVYRITRAECRGEMFRGFETLLEGRSPLDAQQIVQRICGVCPISHALASVRAQEMAYRVQSTANGRLVQNLVLAANLLQSHILHFYQLAALDFVDVTAVLKYSGQDRALAGLKTWLASAMGGGDVSPLSPGGRGVGGEGAIAGPLLPRQQGRYLADAELNHALLAHYAEALQMRRLAHEMGAVFGGRLPHSTTIVPGGCTQAPSEERIRSYRQRLATLTKFAEQTLLADAVALARALPEYWQLGAGYGHMLCFGGLDLDEAGRKLFAPGVLIGGKWQALDAEAIAEEVGSSWFASPSKLHPARGQTKADPGKAAAYSWVKAPRYQGLPMEVGPLARVLVNYHAPQGWPAKAEVDKLLGRLGVGPEKLVSVLGRLACRALEAVLVARLAASWLDQLDLQGPTTRELKPVKRGVGVGLVEAPRGALGHWLTIEDGKIRHYQCVVPTAWNCSPRDDAGHPGPVEKALEGLAVADPQRPIEAGRVVRSFDPCLACAVH